MRPRWFAAVALAILLTVWPATPGSAATSPALQNRLKVACARIPNLTARADAALTRLPSGPDTKGSIAWVQARAQVASDHNRTALAQALNEHANVMTQKLALLPNQLALLQKAQTQCSAAGVTT